MISLHYTCKFCRKPGFAHADESGLTLITQLKWLANICCDRCGRYMVQKRKVLDALAKCCRILEVCRMSRNDKRGEAEAAALQNLMFLTKKLSEIVCSYYRVTNIWEEDFAQMIFDKPTKLSAIVSAYIRGVAHESRKAHENTKSVVKDETEHGTETQGETASLFQGA